jgi:asparagine synthase (glutamine-hydrolysing)
MAHSLETRIPFLDHRLVEFMVRVHKNIKMRFFERKSVLRHSIGKMLPSVVLKAPKKGFVVPLRVWFRGETLSPYVKRVLVENSIDMNKRVLERLVKDNMAGRKDYGNFLWMLIILDGWLRKSCVRQS